MTTSSAASAAYYYPVGRSRRELREIVARAFGWWRGRATSTGATTYVDDTRLVRFHDDYWIGAQLWLETQSGAPDGYVSYVTDFASATGRLTFAPAVAIPSASGDYYQLFRHVTKEEIDDALNEVCRGGQGVYDLTPNTDMTLDYSLNPIETLHRPSQVVAVVRQSLNDDDNVPTKIDGWHIEDNHGLLTLWLPYAPLTTDGLQVIYEIGELGLVTDDAKTTLSPALVKARTLVYLMENILADQDATGLEKWGQLIRYWRERMGEIEKAIPRPAGKVLYYPWGETTTTADPLLAAYGIEERYAT